MAPAPRAAQGRGRMQRQRMLTVAEARRMVNAVPDADVKEFLAAELCGNGALLGRFEARVRRILSDSRGAAYRAAAVEVLDRGSGGGFISHRTPYVSLAGITRDARARERAGDYEEAARMYGQVSEAIIEYLPRIFSVAGRFRDKASRCIRGVGECAARARGSAEGGARMRIVQYLVDRMLDDAETLWLDDYWAALENACRTRGDRKRLLGMLERCLAAGPPADLGRDGRDGWGKYVKVCADELKEQLEAEGTKAAGGAGVAGAAGAC